MSIKTYLHTDSSFKEILHIENLYITQEINSHAYLKMTAALQDKEELDYIRNINTYKYIEIVTDNPEYKTIFSGIIIDITIKQIERTYYLYLECASYSYVSDIEIKSKSFQNKDLLYNELMKMVVFSYDDGDILDKTTNNASIGKLVIQYKETDWEFLKRLASHFNAGLIPDIRFNSPKITIGVPDGQHRGTVEKYNFYVSKDLKKYMVSSKNENKSLSELDTVSLHIETTDDFEIGDKLSYQYDNENNLIPLLCIKSKHIEMIDGTLRFKYELSTEKGLTQDKIYNEKIAGLSMHGTVIDRIQDTIKVCLEIDKEQKIEEAWQFSYTTPYTAEGNSGWYFMPEIGDTVNIYFPNKEEDFAVGLNSIRMKNKGTDKINNPDIKYLRTKDGKEIKLAPNELVITCSNWKNEKTGEENIIYIQLNDKTGINIQSTKPVNITSAGNINFTAEQNILFEAEKEIKLKCQSSEIKMNSAIEISGPDVKIN